MLRLPLLQVRPGLLPGLALALLVGAAIPATSGPARADACVLPTKPTADITLAPGCVRTGTIWIDQPGITLDCKGGTLDNSAGKQTVVTVRAPNVTVKNCTIIAGGGHGILVTSAMSKAEKHALPHAEAYAQSPSNVTISNVTVKNAEHSGIYVSTYVRNTHIDRVTVDRSADAAIYLDQSSMGAVVENSTFTGNGFGSATRPRSGGGRREAIAIDSSSHNVIRNNLFKANGGGGVYLYKNCHEHAANNPQSTVRWMPSEKNTISGNRFENEPTGVWVASRQSRNLTGSECGDPSYAPGIYIDRAPDNTVRDNTFLGGGIGIRVEDDGNTLAQNTLTGQEQFCIRVGTGPRSKVLNKPVVGTVLTGNSCIDVPANRAFVFTDGARPAKAANNKPADGVVLN